MKLFEIGKKPYIPKVLIGMCVYRGIDPIAWECLRVLDKCPNPIITVKTKYNDALISRSRAIVATRFMETDNDVLVFLDDDIIYDPMDVVRLSKLITESGLDIVGGAYVKRQKEDTIFAIKIGENIPVEFGKNGSCFECMYISTGFMAISRRAIQKLIDSDTVPLCHPNSEMRHYPMFNPFWKKIDEQWINLSEDWAFCERLKELGIKIYCDSTAKLKHAGRYEYSWDDMLKGKIYENSSLIYEEKKEGVHIKPILTPA